MNANEPTQDYKRGYNAGVDQGELNGKTLSAITIRQQQAEIEALKKTCLDEITKRVYADQTTKVIEGYWEEAQAEIAALKERMRPCQPLCKPSVCDCRPLNQTYDPKKHGAEE